MGKLFNLPQESSFSMSDFLVKVKAGGAGDELVTLQNFLDDVFAWSSYSPTISGASSISGSSFIYIGVGHLVIVSYQVAGTANGSTVEFTTPATADTSYFYESATGLVIINGAVQSSPGRCYLQDSTHFSLGTAGGTGGLTSGQTFEFRGQVIFKT